MFFYHQIRLETVSPPIFKWRRACFCGNLRAMEKVESAIGRRAETASGGRGLFP
jgi:hypothetical protein